MNYNRAVAEPVIRWVGGKRRLLDAIKPLVPRVLGSFIEPFAGSAAVTLSVLDQFKHVVVADANCELINAYSCIRENCDAIIVEYNKFNNDLETYVQVRSWDRHESFLTERSKFERAARFLFLNKASFQGLWRVNKKGHNNVPYSSPGSVELNVCKLNEFAKATKHVDFICDDYKQILQRSTTQDFVYLDPPYVPISQTSSFTAYTKNGFDHAELADQCKKLDQRGVKFLLSNSDSEIARNLYSQFSISTVEVNRVIAAKKESRMKIQEILVKNF